MKVHRLNSSKFPDIALKSRQAHYPYCPIMLYLLKTLASLATNHIRPFRKTLFSKWLFSLLRWYFWLIFIHPGFRVVFREHKKGTLGAFFSGGQKDILPLTITAYYRDISQVGSSSYLINGLHIDNRY